MASREDGERVPSCGIQPRKHYGSKRHMMIEVFTHREKPFYQFEETLFLEKIAREKWPPFIMEKFSLTVQRAKNALVKLDIIDNFGKVITKEDPIYARWLKDVFFK